MTAGVNARCCGPMPESLRERRCVNQCAVGACINDLVASAGA